MSTMSAIDIDIEDKLNNIMLLTDQALHEFLKIKSVLDSPSTRHITQALRLACNMIEDEQQIFGDKINEKVEEEDKRIRRTEYWAKKEVKS